MLLRKLQSPKNALRSGAISIVGGLMLIQASISLGQSQDLLVHGSVDTRDFLRGFLIGIAIVAEIAGIVMLTRARRHGGRPSHPGGA